MAYPLVKDRCGRLARVIGRSPKGFIRCAMCDKNGRVNGKFGYYLFSELRPASLSTKPVAAKKRVARKKRKT